MSSPLIQRLNYFAGEALLTDDFICEQQYHMQIQSLNNKSLYTYGIAQGLGVYWDAQHKAKQVEVGAGMAIDSLGRQIILLQPQVIALANVEDGATYFLTISYAQVYADYSNETSVAGYKRIIEQPKIQYVRNLQEPGLNVLLAVITFSTQGNINQLTYRSGNIERRYVGSTLGSLNLVAEGAGVYGNAMPDALSGLFIDKDNVAYPSLSAKRESSGPQTYLSIDATRSQFSGLLTTRNNLGIGIDQPLANLQINAINFKGPGVLSSADTTVTLSVAVSPFFQVGDQLTSNPPVTTMSNGQVSFGLAQTRTITAIDQANLQVTVATAFNPPLQNIGYTYIRSTLARFGLANGNSYLSVGIDGRIGLGMPSSTKSGLAVSGPNALLITSDRKVGIALSSGEPQATLDVNGKIKSDQLQTGGIVASGVVQAQSFEGNGSKLAGLPILSYWTRQTVGTLTSNLYYNEGNVGIRNTNPPASLSVGGGNSFIGAGLVTAITSNVLQGYNTDFHSQVNTGDTITVGMLIDQIGNVTQVISDTELMLQDQLPVPILNSDYRCQPANGSAQAGTGQISSNGTTIIGNGTKFLSEVSVGGKIIVARFEPQTSFSQASIIDKVTDATHLTLKSAYAVDVTASTYTYQVGSGSPQPGTGTISSVGIEITGVGTDFSMLKSGDSLIIPPSNDLVPKTLHVHKVLSPTQLELSLSTDGKNAVSGFFPAAVSAFVVTPSLLTYIAANSDNGVLPPEQALALPPALLVSTNSVKEYPNTVAINVAVDQIKKQYALQVVGDVNFDTSTLDVKNLLVQTLTASKSITVLGDDGTSNLLAVGKSGGANPLLTVTQNNVTVGPGAAPYQLETNGAISATGNIVSQATVQGANLSGNAMQVAGTMINAAGNVQIIGERVAYNQSNLTNGGTTFQQVAVTDGYVMATVGQPSWSSAYSGSLQGTTQNGQGQTSFVYATGLAYQYNESTGKKSGTTLTILVPGSFTMPVKQGETWSLKLTATPPVNVAPQIEFYWIPLGPAPAGGERVAAPQAMLAGGGMAASWQQLQDDVASGRVSDGAAVNSQQAIQQRVDDLTQILGQVTHMSSDPQNRAQFMQSLQKIVCSPAAPPQLSNTPAFEADLKQLADAFAKATGSNFTELQRGLLEAGIRALVQINDSDANRHDLSLIKNNIDLFIDNVQQILQLQPSSGDRRLLTRALVRIVGDGRAAPPDGT